MAPRIAFDKTGSGPAVILVNGAMQYRAMDPSMAKLAELLSKDFTVYSYDRRGRGESGDTHLFAKEREIEDIMALVEETGGSAKAYATSASSAFTVSTGRGSAARAVRTSSMMGSQISPGQVSPVGCLAEPRSPRGGRGSCLLA